MAAVVWELDVITSGDTLAQIDDILEMVWSAHARIPDAVRTRMGIASTEIAANIVSYSGHGLPVRMLMQVRCCPDRVEISFADDGHPAEVDLSAVTMPREWAERGRGLAMARAVVERLSYRRTRAVNHWTLVSEAFTRSPLRAAVAVQRLV
jgi:serine/threonine-protein kinase RsbW